VPGTTAAGYYLHRPEHYRRYRLEQVESGRLVLQGYGIWPNRQTLALQEKAPVHADCTHHQTKADAGTGSGRQRALSGRDCEEHHRTDFMMKCRDGWRVTRLTRTGSTSTCRGAAWPGVTTSSASDMTLKESKEYPAPMAGVEARRKGDGRSRGNACRRRRVDRRGAAAR
jgi:hypothetical protein